MRVPICVPIYKKKAFINKLTFSDTSAQKSTNDITVKLLHFDNIQAQKNEIHHVEKTVSMYDHVHMLVKIFLLSWY